MKTVFKNVSCRIPSAFLLSAVLLSAMGCTKEIKSDLAEAKDRLDMLEGTTITTINEQITAINSSITDLQSMDETLDGYIKTLETTAENLQKQINDANSEIAKVESELGEEITALEQSLLNELNSAKEAIQAELSAINKTLDDLKAADTALDKKIAELRTYVDTELASTKDWANATFSTLTQYEQTQTEISNIKASIEQINAGMSALETRLNGKIATDIQAAIDALRSELNADHASLIESAVNNVTTAYSAAISSAKSEITSAYTTAISSAIVTSESNLKTWVSEQLTQGYYDIATIDGKLQALSGRLNEADEELQKQIDQQKQALQQAKSDLTKEYKQYIDEAIAAGGIIDSAIAAQVKKAQDELQSKIDAINERLDAFEDRLGKLENDFVNRIQSLKFVPEYSDRVVPVSDYWKSIVMDFMVSPASMAQSIADAWKSDRSVLTAYIRYTKAPVSRVASGAVPLSVSSVSATSDGDLRVMLAESSVFIDADFLSGECQAVVYIKISDGNTDVISDLVDVAAYRDEEAWAEAARVADLSASGSANCYIISQSGNYKFKPFKGNSTSSVGSVASAEVLWETFGTDVTPDVGDLVTSAEYKDGYIAFQTPYAIREGNAVIAAKDADGNILWSWHIWFTDQPQGQEYYNNAGTMMDRNLGATSATPGDVGALGLLYQWGRKDPFLGSSFIGGAELAKSTITWPSVVESNSSNGTISYATAHPTTFITYNSSNYDWYYTGSSSTDDTRWTTSSEAKSIYDPCPAGWRVPDGGSNGIWSKASGSSSLFDYTYNSSSEGMNFSGKFGSASTIWYPASGYRYDNDGGLNGVVGGGHYWSASPFGYGSSGACYLGFGNDGYVSPSYYGDRAYGSSVRCQKE